MKRSADLLVVFLTCDRSSAIIIAARESAHIANLGDKLSGSDAADAIHGVHDIVFRQLPGKTVHLLPQTCKQFVCGCEFPGGGLDQQLRYVGFWQ